MRRPGRPWVPSVATVLVLAAGAAALTGCRGGSASDTELNPGTQELVILVYDRSTSMPDHLLELSRRLAEERIDRLDHGDRIAAMELLQLSLAEPPKRWSQQVPEREFQNRRLARDSVTRVRFLRDAKAYLAPFARTEDRDNVQGTDILSTLHDVAEELRAYPDHRATLYLFSDMLQVNREMNMEGLVRMPPRNWVSRADAAGTLPDLTDLCVVVMGARVDTHAAQRVKEFWTEYFEATGAILHEHNYTLRPVRLPDVPCPGRR